MSTAFVRAAVLALLIGACGSGSDGVSLAISPPLAELVPGQTLQLVAQDADGQPVAVVWTSSDPGKATVSASGVVEGVAVGFTRITASTEDESAMSTASVREGAMVGPAGASVSARDGAVVVDVPAGAVEAPTPVAIVVADGPPLDPRVVGGTAVTVTIGGALAEAATLSLGYDPARGPYGLPEGRLHVASLADDAWSDLADSVDDPVAQRAEVAITTTGSYAVRQADATAPCTAAEDRQFDFWLGRWSDIFLGQGPATSEITRDDEGCNVYEYFSGGGNHGRSVSFFNADTGLWYQTYIDDGGRLLLGGTLMNDAMVLRSPGTTAYSRITWSKEDGGKVRQLGESTTDGGTTWITTFDGTYTPMP